MMSYEEMMKDMDNFKKRRAIQEGPENFKMGVVVVLVMSLFLFTAIGEENSRNIIWYWASLMVVLTAIAVALDIHAYLKIKKLGIQYKKQK